MNFIKFFLVIVLALPLLAQAEVEFSVSTPAATPAPSTGNAPPVKPDEDEQSTRLGELKFMGVSQWLQGYLGERYTQYEKWITPELAEKYVLDYKVGKAADGSTEISGHLDADSLKRWVRLMDMKVHGTTKLKVLYVISSTVPGLTLAPSETASRAKETAFGNLSTDQITAQFKSFNTTPVPAGNTFTATIPPTSSSDISALSRTAGQSGANVVFWTQLGACAACGGMRLDFFLYSAVSDRLVKVDSQDVTLSLSDANNVDKLSPVLTQAFQGFKKEVDDAISGGKVFADEYYFRVEGIENYRAFKIIDQELPKQDHVTEVVVRKAGNHTAEFSFLSSRSIDELAQKLQQLDLGAFRLKLVRVESKTLVFRFVG